MPAAPFMHGGGQWNAFATFHMGGTVIIPSHTSRLDPTDLWSTIERESVAILSIIGDAFARPLIDELHRRSYDLSALRFVTSGGVTLSAALKSELMELVPHLMVIDVVGSSESGVQGQHTSFPGGAATGTFAAGRGASVLTESLDRALVEPSDDLGWLAQTGAIPLGYLGDQAKTAATFPIVGDVRYSIPGDRARRLAGGEIQFLGRDSATINTGGEKVFAEEVEQALRSHPAVHDAVVVGLPSERWGHKVVALVRLRDGASASAEELIEACGHHIARYKVPKALHLIDHIERSPAGKADYRWAKSQAEIEAARLGPAGPD